MSGCIEQRLAETAADHRDSAYGYLGFTDLESYDVLGCAAQCNEINGCVSINIYFERDPSVDPGTGNNSCSDPASTTNIKCAFWGGPVDTANAVNAGQYQNEFEVVIAGSNGYQNNSIADVPGYGTAVPLGSAAINAPYDEYGCDSYLGVAIFTDGPFDAQLCADACSMKSAYNVAHPPSDGSLPQTCQFFNTYLLYVNDTSHIKGQYCAMYSESWDSSYATNVGQYSGSDHYLIEYSFAYSNATSPGSANAACAVSDAEADIVYSSLQPYCSTLLGYTTPVSTIVSTTTTTPIVTTSSYLPATVTATATTTVFVAKRQDSDDTDVDLATISIPFILPASVQSANLSTSIAYAAVEKRGASTQTVLTRYPSNIVSSACSLQATPVSITSSISQVSTVTAPTSSAIVTVLSLSTTTVVLTSTSHTKTASTTTTTSTTPTQCTPNPSSFKITVSGSGKSSIDGYSLATLPLNYNVIGAGSVWHALGLERTFSLSSSGRLSTGGYSVAFNDFINPGTVALNNLGDYPYLTCSIDPKTFVLGCSAGNPDLVRLGLAKKTTYTQLYMGTLLGSGLGMLGLGNTCPVGSWGVTLTASCP